MRITSGSAIGDLRICTRVDPDAGQLIPNREFSAAIANTDTYEVWGASINGAAPLTNLVNDVLRGLTPITFTRLLVERLQRQYAVTASINRPEDVLAVWERTFNRDVGGDYDAKRVAWLRPKRGDGGVTPTVTIEIEQPLVFPTTLLNGSVTDSIATLTVDGTADVPSPEVDFPSSGRLVVESELIDYTGTTATTFTGCTRGVGNSVAATHADNIRVDQANGVYYYTEHYTTFTAFTSDTVGTIDAIYRDWVAWEVALRHSRAMLATGVDAARWRGFREWAAENVLSERGKWQDQRGPIPILPYKGV